MHVGKVSVVVAQVSLTSASVLAGENMGKRNSWEDVKPYALSNASQAAAKFNQRNAAPVAMITPAPEKRQFFGGNRQNNGLEAGHEQGLTAALAAQGRVGKIAADFNSRFPPFPGFRNNNKDKRDINPMDQGQQYNDNPNPQNQWADNNGAYQSYYSGAAAQGQAYASAAAAANGAYNDANQAQQGWQAASDWQFCGSVMGASWSAYGASVATSAQAQASEAVASAQGVVATAAAGNDGKWHGDVASAQSLASSYRSEHQDGVAHPTRVQPTPSAPHGTHMVQVNEGPAGLSAAEAVGVAAAMAGFVFGML